MIRTEYRLAGVEDWELEEAIPVNDFPVDASGFYFCLRIGRSLR